MKYEITLRVPKKPNNGRGCIHRTAHVTAVSHRGAVKKAREVMKPEHVILSSRKIIL